MGREVCFDDVVAFGFPWVKVGRTYLTRDAARQDVFDCIEMFYNPTPNNGMWSLVDC